MINFDAVNNCFTDVSAMLSSSGYKTFFRVLAAKHSSARYKTKQNACTAWCFTYHLVRLDFSYKIWILKRKTETKRKEHENKVLFLSKSN